MCSIGWKKLDSGFLIFKNRDRYPHEKIENRLIEDDLVIGFGDDTFPGVWLGINKKYGFAILTAWGPRERKNKLEDNFYLVEDALRFGISPESALERFKAKAEEELQQSYNLIFCDSSKAIELEFSKSIQKVQSHQGMVVKTNDFVILDQMNNQDSHALTSTSRRKLLDYIFPSHESPDEMKSLLSFHSNENPLGNVCRHDYATTIASVFAYVRTNQIHLYYSLDRSPEERNYEEKTILVNDSK
jgi:hypothetical protein